MKKTTKILSLLMALVMIFSLTTVALADDADVTLGTTSLTTGSTTKTLEEGTPTNSVYLRDISGDETLASVNKAVGESGYWQRLPRNTLIGNTWSQTFVPVSYAVPRSGSVKVTNNGVIGNCKFSLEKWEGNIYPGTACLTFLFDALNEGSTDVTLTYYYNYKITGISGGNQWYKETATFTVTVGEGGEVIVDPATKPDKPTVNDVEGFYDYVNKTSSATGAVYMWCDTTYNHHAWFSHLTDVEDGYSLGEVVPNDGSVKEASASQYPWMCKMTVYADKYMEAYNEEMGVKHYLETPGSTETVKWFWNANTGWDYAYSGPVYFIITHTAPTPPVTEYTVTYTDGVNGTAFADQVYTVKSGDATPAFNGTPEREGYVFLGWEPEVAETVTGDATYTAKWEEALTEVKVTSNKQEGSLLLLGDELKVTVKTNVKADSITITPTLNGAFKQIASDTAADGTKTIYYRVTKIIGNYTTLSFTATATKGSQTPVSDTLTFGVNLRNRIHVSVTKKVSGETVTDAAVQLMHKYPQWNTSPMLKFDAAKKEYVMKNPWDLSNQQYNAVNITIGDKTYSVNKTSDGRDLMSVILAGTEEIYVNYVVVDPIKVTINVDGKQVAQQEFEGSEGDVLNYSKLYWAVMDELRAAGAIPSVALTYDNGATAAVFGQCTNVTVNITTNGTITVTGEDFPWDSGESIIVKGDDFIWG